MSSRRVVVAAPIGVRPEDRYFLAMAIFMAGAVVLGFGHNYYESRIYHFPYVPNRLVAAHATVATTWILLFIAQIGLVARRQVALHRRLGVFGAVLAAAMVGLGLAAATDSLARGFEPPGFPFGPRTFYAEPIFNITAFAVLAGAALWMRRTPAAHKRLMLIATIGLMDAAVNRWPFDVIRHVPFATTAILYAMIVSVAVFDWWSLRRIHRVTIIGGVFLALALLAAIPVGMTSAWQHVAALAAHAWRGGA